MTVCIVCLRLCPRRVARTSPPSRCCQWSSRCPTTRWLTYASTWPNPYRRSAPCSTASMLSVCFCHLMVSLHSEMHSGIVLKCVCLVILLLFVLQCPSNRGEARAGEARHRHRHGRQVLCPGGYQWYALHSCVIAHFNEV